MNETDVVEVLQPPFFTEGKTPEDLRNWAAGKYGANEYYQMKHIYGENIAMDLLVSLYEREQLIDLLSGRVDPANDEQTAFLAAVKSGTPFSLLTTGNRHLAEQGFQPTMRKMNSGQWFWQFGNYSGESMELEDALQFYMAAVNRISI